MPRSGLGALLLLASLATGCGLATRPVEVYYRAGWMLAHLDDQRAFPPKSNLCMETFCTRTDTSKKFAGGRKGYTSQAYYYYCPAHSPSFVNTGSRLDGLLRFFYWGAVFLLSYLLAFGLFVVPAKGGLLLVERLRPSTRVGTDLSAIGAPLAVAAFAASSLAWLAFAIW